MKNTILNKITDQPIRFTGTVIAFIVVGVLVLVWGILGSVFSFSPTWRIAISTGITLITFSMIFFTLKSQNNDSKAMQIKLNELVKAHEQSNNRIVDIEDHTEEKFQKLYEKRRKIDSNQTRLKNEQHASNHRYK